MIGGFVRRMGWFYVVTVDGGILVLAAVILARSAYDGLRDWWRHRARR